MKRALHVVFLITLMFNIIHPNNCYASNIKSVKNKSEWKKFNPTETISAKKLAQNKAELKLGKYDHLNLIKYTEDELGFTHYQYQQNYKGIPVEQSSYIIHELNGKVQSSNGTLIRNLKLNTHPSIQEEAALAIALKSMPSSKYAWEDENFKRNLKHIKQNEKASYFPIGTLVIIDNQLSYKFEVYSLKPLSRKEIFIDAHNGSLIRSIEKLHFCSSFTATGNSNYYNEVDFTSCYEEGSYFLRNDIGGGMQVLDAQTKEVITENDEFFNEDKTATEVHWATQKTFEYFLNAHERNSLDNNGAPLYSNVHATISGDSLNNAYWDGEQMFYGDGDGERYGSFTSLDIVAHEMMHGITEYSGNKLSGNSISRALNESFSDIFGEVVEAANKDEGPDWIAGSDIVISPGFNGLRNLANPSDGNMIQIQPNTYEGKYWADTNTLESIHINSGVQNHWFYLLAEGGSGINDKGGAYFINGIGIDKAAKIAYRNLVHYLQPESDYMDARNGSIQAASELYGPTEVEQTIAAWCAVGVGEDCEKSSLTCRQRDSLNLINFYNATDGNNWTTPWDTSQSVKRWIGIGFNENDCLKSIQLINNNLRGALPEVLGDFSDLENLILSQNELSGTLPKGIGKLAKLTTLNLNNNALSGTIPDEIKSLIQLQDLDLSQNSFEGVVLPNVLYYLKELNSVNLSENYFSGKIPNGTFSLPKLEIINLSKNKFDGIIPQKLPYFPVLNSLNVSNNNLSGNIPSSFDRMPNIKSIVLSKNSLEGDLPAALSQLNQLRKLEVQNNGLSGCYHPALASLNNQLIFKTNNYISDGNQFDSSWENFIANPALGCSPPACRLTDSLSLVQLYESANGSNWNVQWDFSQPMDTWQGVTLNFDRCVSHLYLDYFFGLSGYLDPVIGNLNALEELSIYDADFEGGIPIEIGQLSNLSKLSLINSKLSGEIPAQIGQLESLETLNLRGNRLKGSIPDEIGQLNALDVLILENNQLTGNIPNSIVNLSQLTQLWLNENFLNGSIPDEINNLKLLKNFYINSNLINGSLPAELGDLNNLEFVNLSNNLLDGCYDLNLIQLCDQIYPSNNKNYNISDHNNFNIPWEDFCNYGASVCSSPCRVNDSLALVKLYKTTEGFNWRYKWDLNKPISSWWGVQLNENGCIESLNLSNNKLYGYIPSEIKELKTLTSLNLANNTLSGSIPNELIELRGLKTLDISNNQLTGEMPLALGKLLNLNHLWLAQNNLNGDIPASLGELIYLENLNLSENDLTGSIPSVIANLPQLTFLYLFNNQLSGCYNPTLNSLCETLDPFQNLLGNYRISRGNNFDKSWDNFCGQNAGICQSNPCQQTDALILEALYNQNNGPNWNSFYQWNFDEPMNTWFGVTLNEEGCVSELSLPAVGLQNQLSHEIGSLSHLRKLNLWGNELTGQIPSSLGNLQQLEILYLPNNQLTGGIPDELCHLNMLSQLYLQDNQLGGDLPPNLGNLKNLELLQLHNNQFIGSIPTELADLPVLQNLALQSNGLSSCYPMALQNLCNKENALYWNISEGNQFDASWEDFCTIEMGSCPITFSIQTDSLALLALYAAAGGSNWLNPWDLSLPMSTWEGIQVNSTNRVTGISLSDNNLQGIITDKISYLNLLKQLDLSNNNLTGEIPYTFGSIENLTNLNLSYNNLNGCYSEALNNLCDQLNSDNNNELISEGNQLQAAWEDFCNFGNEICYSGDVWPGDFSNDGVVDVYDVLYWGLSNGGVGSIRENASKTWSPQPATEWSNFVNGINAKHQDGNGDGIVDELDLQLVDINYGKTRDLNLNIQNESGLNFDLKAVGIVYDVEGISLNYDLNIDVENDDPLHVHGIAGSIDLGDLPVKDIQIDIENSSIEADEYKFVHNTESNVVDVALTRTDKTNKSTAGSLARIVIAIDDFQTGDSFEVKTNGGTTMSANGTLTKMGSSSTYGSFNANDNFTKNLSVFVSTKQESCNNLGKAELNITNGTPPFSYQWSNGETSSKVENLPSGDYNVTVTDVDGLTANIPFKINGQTPIYDENDDIECGSNCAYYIEADNYLSNGIYQAGNTLNSKAVISKRENVEFKAGETIILENGFSIDVESNFSAGIEECE